MKIEMIAVSELKPYENNPRFNEPAVEKVMNSIKEFGFKVPIVIDTENVIVAGHTRLLAAQKLGLETVPCIVANDLNDEQIKAFRLADNKVSELAEWDFSKLEQELSDIQNTDMFNFGFEDFNVVDVIPKQKTKNDFDIIDDELETEHKCPKCGYCW